MPDGFVIINFDGFVMGGDKPFIRNQNLFDYVTSKDANDLKKAVSKATEKIPSYIDISFRLHEIKIKCFCMIYKSGNLYLIGGWRISEKIIRFPDRGTAV
jgi:hypothetical protein